MKILYIITQGEMGGAQLYVKSLAEASKGRNWAFDLALGENNKNWLSQEVGSLGGRIWPLKHLKREISPLEDFLVILELFRLLHKINPDVVHLNSSKAGVVGSFASLAYRISGKKTKVIYTAHGWVFNEPMNFFKKLIFIWLEKITSPIKDKIICVSEFDRTVGIKSSIKAAGNLITIHNGIELPNEYFLNHSEAREKIGAFSNDCLVIGTIVNFYKTKGLEFLISAFDLLVKNNKEKYLKLAIIGDGEMRQQLEKLIASCGLNDKVVLLGRIDQASKYLRAFDIFVMSSVKEGLPYSLLEAQLAGVPIVATKVGGIPEIINDGVDGLLTRPKDPIDLAAKMQILIDNASIKDGLVQSSIKKVTNDFSLEEMLQKTLSLYK